GTDQFFALTNRQPAASGDQRHRANVDNTSEKLWAGLSKFSYFGGGSPEHSGGVRLTVRDPRRQQTGASHTHRGNEVAPCVHNGETHRRVHFSRFCSRTGKNLLGSV